MEMVLVPPLQTLLHPPLLFRWEGQGELVQSQGVLKYTVLITQTTSYDSARVASVARNLQHSRCARQKCTPSLQALAGKRVVASLLGHSRLVALCSLALSQEGQKDP